MNKKIISVFLLILTISLLFVACGKKEVKKVEKVTDVTSVTVDKIKTKDVELTTYAIGRLAPKATYNVMALNPGDVVKTYFEIGDTVKKDDILFILDKEDFNTDKSNQLTQLENSLSQAKISLDDAKENYEDNVKLYNAGSVSKQILDNSKNQYDKAKLQYNNILTQIKTAKDNFRNQEENLVIVSPTDGIIANKNVEEDMYATSQNGYTIIKNNPIIFKAGVVEEYINKIQPGQNTEVYINSLDKTVKGKVKSVALMKEGTTYPVEIEIENGELNIKPDMFAEVNIKYDTFKNGVVVSSKSVIEKNGDTYIFIKDKKTDDGFRVKKVSVDILGRHDNLIHIANEELLGKEVIVKGSTFIDKESIVKVK